MQIVNRFFRKNLFVFVALTLVLILFTNNVQAQWERTSGTLYGNVTGIVAIPNPAGGTKIFAGTKDSDFGGVFVSTDDGVSWTNLMSNFYYPYVTSLTTTSDGAGGIIVIAGTEGEGIFWSIEGGDWTQASGIEGRYVQALTRNSNGVLFAGTANDGVYQSIDNGANWNSIGLTGKSISSLAISPNGKIFAATYGHGVFRSEDNGASWIESSSGLVTLRLVTITVGANGYLFAGNDYVGAFRSTNDGLSWTGITGTQLTYPDVRSLVMSGNNLFAGTYGGGVFLSTNNGTNWIAVNTGFTNTYTQISVLAVAPNGNLLAAINQDVVWKRPISQMIPDNLLPIANAGPDQTVNVGTQVTLNGSASSDPDGDALTYAWNEGSTNLGATAQITQTFLAGIHTITLTVNDGKGGISTDTVVITVNTPPIANAGSDQTVNVGTQVTLNGSSSADPDGDALTYAWNEGLTNLGTAAQITQTLPAGIHTITLTVNDGKGGISTDNVVITVNTPPIANAGPDQSVNAGTQVTLDGSASSDQDTDVLTYTWIEGTDTLGTGAQLMVTLPTGVHTITLTVNDNKGGTSSDNVAITIVGTTGPKITVANKPMILWPPNHHFETVKPSQIVVSVVDHTGKKISIQNVRIYSVSSDEAEDAPCNGNKHFNKHYNQKHYFDFNDRKYKNHGQSDDDDECDDRGDRCTKDDIVISRDAKKVDLRAERQTEENGRVYTITLVVKDGSGNVGYATYEVWVPLHKKEAAINNGPAYTEYAKSNAQFAKENEESSSELSSTLPEQFKLYDNFPNPFNPSPEIRFAIPTDDFVSLKVYDLAGHEIATLMNNQLTTGTYFVHFNASKLSSGTYIYRLTTSTNVMTKKMLLMK